MPLILCQCFPSYSQFVALYSPSCTSCWANTIITLSPTQVPRWLRRGQLQKPLPPPGTLLTRVRQQVLAWSKLRVNGDLDVEKILPLDAGETYEHT